METEETPTTTTTSMKDRLVGTAKKIKPYAIGFGIGVGTFAVGLIVRDTKTNNTILKKIEDDSIEITELPDGGFQITEHGPVEEFLRGEDNLED